MSKIDIINKLIKILNMIKKQEELYIDCNYDKPLTGIDFRFSSIDMMYLVLEISREFGVSFQDKDFENYNFNTINNIALTVQAKIIRSV